MPRRNHKHHKMLPAERAALERERQRKQEAAKVREERFAYAMGKLARAAKSGRA